MQAFKISNLRSVPSLDQRLESLLDQRSQTAAQHSLLAEQITLGFFPERILQHAGACRANSMRIRQSKLVRPLARVLADRDQRRHAATLGINTPQQMPRRLGRAPHHVHIARRNNRLEMNAES